MNPWHRAVLVAGAVSLIACDDKEKAKKAEKWDGPCIDEAVLVATTAGSPSGFKCWNKHHRMRVQVATQPSHEEVGALIFCECERAGEPARRIEEVHDE